MTFRETLHEFVDGRATAAELAGLSADDLSKIATLAISSLRAGMLDQATRQLDLLARLRPDLYLPYHYLGLVALKRAQFETAVTLLDHASVLLDKGKERSASLEKVKQEIDFLALDAVRKLGDRAAAEERATRLRRLGNKLDARIAKALD
jgi:hypothetical protein